MWRRSMVSPGFRPARKGCEVSVLDIGREVGRLDARHVGRDHLREGLARRLAQGIEDGAVEQRRTVGGDQRIEAELGAARDLLAIGAGVQAERRVEAARRVVLDGDVAAPGEAGRGSARR